MNGGDICDSCWAEFVKLLAEIERQRRTIAAEAGEQR